MLLCIALKISGIFFAQLLKTFGGALRMACVTGLRMQIRIRPDGSAPYLNGVLDDVFRLLGHDFCQIISNLRRFCS